jgi:hypothetical protein
MNPEDQKSTQFSFSGGSYKQSQFGSNNQMTNKKYVKKNSLTNNQGIIGGSVKIGGSYISEGNSIISSPSSQNNQAIQSKGNVEIGKNFITKNNSIETVITQPVSFSSEDLKSMLSFYQEKEKELTHKLIELSEDIESLKKLQFRGRKIDTEELVSLEQFQEETSKQKKLIKELLELINLSSKNSYSLDTKQNFRLQNIEQNLNMFSQSAGIQDELSQQSVQAISKTAELISRVQQS